MMHFIQKYFPYLGLIFVLYSFFFFGLQHISEFITADEHYWVEERIPQYWDALRDGKWKKTFINDKPGVSLALVSGVGYALHSDSRELCVETESKIIDCQNNIVSDVYRDFRLPILITNGILLCLFFFLLIRLTNPWIALWTVTLTALSPILLGISQIINPDSLLWSFVMIAVFSFFNLLKFAERKFLWLTILFTGLALLTKYVAVILFPFYFLLILSRFLTNRETISGDTESLSLRKNIFTWVMIVIGSFLIFFLFLPALLIDSKYLTEMFTALLKQRLLLSLSSILFIVLFIDVLHKHILLSSIRNTSLSLGKQLRFFPLLFLMLFSGLIIIRNFFPDWGIFTLIAFDIKDLSDARYTTDIPNFFEAFLLEWNPIVFSLTPIVLTSFFTLLILLLGRKTKEHTFLVYTLLFFSLAYSILLIYSNVLATPRYSIILYPIFSFLSALGFWHIAERFPRWYARPVITLCILIGSFVSLLASEPFYFNYTNTLLPKNVSIQDAWGYGGYEASEYLNSLPNATNLTVWADYYGVCEFFVGRCLTAYTFDKSTIQPDYYVLTRRGKIRYMPRYDRWEEKSGLTAYKYYATPDPDWQLFIDDRRENFIKVVRVEKK